jgi:hypothetical protein
MYKYFQYEFLNLNAKKRHGGALRARACSRKCFVRIRDAAPGNGHSHVSLQTVMHGLAAKDSNNPLCFLLLWMGLCNAQRQ